MIFVIIAVVIIILLILWCVKIVPQANEWVYENMGSRFTF